MSIPKASNVRWPFQPLRFSPGRAGIQVCTLLTSIFFAIILPVATVAKEIQSPKLTIKVGVRDDVKPFSYVDTTRDTESILPGYSGYSIEVCRHVFKEMQKLPQYRHFTFTAGKTKAHSRFKQLGAAGNLFMLCGPDSISADRLLDFRSSHPVFLTGMTYAYINPRSRKFPRRNYCEHVVGVVRGTTADTQGLEDLASRNLLMRFDVALDLEVHKKSGRVEKSLQALQEITEDVLDDAQKEITKHTKLILRSELETPAIKVNAESEASVKADAEKHRLKLLSQSREIRNTLTDTELNGLYKALVELEVQGMGMAAKIIDLMAKEYGNINAQVAREIVTDECPEGFTSMPVRKFETHKDGIAAFCKGDVLYYLADYDILKNKTQEIADCDIVMNRFTRSREVYGVYFPKSDTFDSNPESSSEPLIDVASFYADFNYFLLLAMQGERSVLEDLFEQEFGVQQKSEELERFFDGFKFYTP